MSRSIAAAIGAAVLIGAMLLAGCSSSTTPASSPAASPSAASPTASPGTAQLASLVSKRITEREPIVIGDQFGFPPFDYYEADAKTPAGFDVDIIHMVADLTGIKFKFLNSNFSAMIPGLLAKRYDMYINLVGEDATRNKQIDFVDYVQGGSGYLFKLDNPRHIKTRTDLCGATVVYVQGTSDVQQRMAPLADQCKSLGKDGPILESQPTDPSCLLAVETGRADAYTSGLLSLGYIAKTHQGVFGTLPDGFPPNMYGIVFRPGDTQLEALFSKTLDYAIKHGQYAGVLAKYGLQGEGITSAVIRTPTSNTSTAS